MGNPRNAGLPASQILAGSNVPLGGVVSLWGSLVNPTINGAEYLRSGNLKAVGAYASFAAACPNATYNVSTVTGNKSIPSTQLSIRYAGTSYFILANAGNTTAYSSTLTTAVNWNNTVGSSETTCNDAFAFNTRLIFLPNTQDLGYFIDGTTGAAAAFSPTSAGYTYCGASNAAGTLAATGPYAFNGASSMCSTSTNGTVWTLRAPSAIGYTAAHLMAWCVPSSTFICITSAGLAASSPDGFTYTARGVVIAGVSSCSSQAVASDYSCYSATATLFSAQLTVSGVVGNYLIRTTDGVNFTTVLWSTLLGFTPTTVPRLSNNGTLIVASVGGDPRSDSTFIWQSLDSGVTWAAMTTPINSANAVNQMGVSQLRFLNGSWVVYPAITGGGQIYTITSFAATHVGMPALNQQGISGAAVSLLSSYLRIK